MSAAPIEADVQHRYDDQWYWIAVTSGILALFCYFFSAVFHVFPWNVSRILFYSFGPTLTLAAFAGGALLRARGIFGPFFQIGILFTCIAGIAVNMMAVIQDSNFTMMRESIREAELESTKDLLLQILWGINWVQLSFDIVFDIWIAGGCFFLALGTLFYLRQRILGGAGMLIGAMALGVNFATLPHPPAEAGLFDPGPLVATWFGVFLGLVMLWHRRGKLR
jgi:hypothetical protein